MQNIRMGMLAFRYPVAPTPPSSPERWPS